MSCAGMALALSQWQHSVSPRSQWQHTVSQKPAPRVVPPRKRPGLVTPYLSSPYVPGLAPLKPVGYGPLIERPKPSTKILQDKIRPTPSWKHWNSSADMERKEIYHSSSDGTWKSRAQETWIQEERHKEKDMERKGIYPSSSDGTWNSRAKETWIQEERYQEIDAPSSDGTWNSRAKETWIQEERYQEIDTPSSDRTWNSRAKETWRYQEIDASSSDGTWNSRAKDTWIQDETWSNWTWNTWNSKETKWIQNKGYKEKDMEREEQIRRTKEVLQRHRRQGAGKRRRCPRRPSWPPPKKNRKGQSGKARKCAKERDAKLGEEQKKSKVDVEELRFSQSSCKETFQCGRSVPQLVQDLLDRKVSLSAPFLRLTVFDTTDEKTGEPILRCIDNRRLFALKEYAKKCGNDYHPVMVNVNLYSISQDTLKQVRRFIQNSDSTDGRDVRMRKKGSNKRR